MADTLELVRSFYISNSYKFLQNVVAKAVNTQYKYYKHYHLGNELISLYYYLTNPY